MIKRVDAKIFILWKQKEVKRFQQDFQVKRKRYWFSQITAKSSTKCMRSGLCKFRQSQTRTFQDAHLRKILKSSFQAIMVQILWRNTHHLALPTPWIQSMMTPFISQNPAFLVWVCANSQGPPLLCVSLLNPKYHQAELSSSFHP